MDPTKSNDSLENLDAEEKALRDEAMQIDPVRPEDASIEDDTTGEQAAPSAEETAKQTSEAAKKAAADKAAADKAAADKASKDSADKSAADKAAADKAAADKAAEEKNLTPYEKERRRLNSSWKKLEEEKAAVRKERETFEAERKKFEEERAKGAATAAKPKAEKPRHNGFTAEDYETAAKDFRAEGKIDAAELAEKRAKELRDKEAEQAKEAGGATASGEFVRLSTGARITPDEQKKMEAEWQTNLRKLADENPDLTKDGTPLRNEVAALLKPGAHPILHSHASGIFYAVEVAKLKLAAAEVPMLKQRLTELEAENKRLTELTSLDASGAGANHRDKPKIEDLPIEDAEKALRDEAMAADARSG